MLCFTAVDAESAGDAALELCLLSEPRLEVTVDLPLADEGPVAALGVPVALGAAPVRVGCLDSLEFVGGERLNEYRTENPKSIGY